MVSNPRRKARWLRRRAVSSTVGGYPAGDKQVADLNPPPLSLWSMSYRPIPDEWSPDVANAHLQDAARGLSSLCLPLHPPPLPPTLSPAPRPGGLPTCQNYSAAGRRRC